MIKHAFRQCRWWCCWRCGCSVAAAVVAVWLFVAKPPQFGCCYTFNAECRRAERFQLIRSICTLHTHRTTCVVFGHEQTQSITLDNRTHYRLTHKTANLCGAMRKRSTPSRSEDCSTVVCVFVFVVSRLMLFGGYGGWYWMYIHTSHVYEMLYSVGVRWANRSHFLLCVIKRCQVVCPERFAGFSDSRKRVATETPSLIAPNAGGTRRIFSQPIDSDDDEDDEPLKCLRIRQTECAAGACVFRSMPTTRLMRIVVFRDSFDIGRHRRPRQRVCVYGWTIVMIVHDVVGWSHTLCRFVLWEVKELTWFCRLFCMI